jgi:hypothetical protein
MLARRSLYATALALPLALFCCPSAASGQEVSLTPFGGFRVGGYMQDDYSGVHYDINDDWTYGGALDIGISGGRAIELLFSHQGTEMTAQGGALPTVRSADLTVDLWQAGLLEEKPISPTVSGYGVGTLGVTRFAWLDDSSTRFSIGFGGGVKAFPTGTVGLRLDARGYVTFVDTDAAYVGAGGSGLTVSFASDVLFQAEFMGGVVFRFGGTR